MNTDFGDSSTSDDHGLLMDSASATHDDIGENLDLVIDASTDDLGIPSGSSVPQQSSSTVMSGDLRCINCGVNVSRMQTHTLEIAEVRCLIQRCLGLQQVQVSSDSLVCHTCWTNAWDEIRHATSPGPVVGHVNICISCGISVLRRCSHILNIDSLREAAIRNMIAQQIAPRQLPRYLCHTCWRRTDRAASRSTVERDTVAASSPQEVSTVNTSQEEGRSDVISNRNEILLPNYIRAPSTQRQCFFPGCNGTERCLIPSSLRVNLLCDYNYYVPSDCRICFYHLSSNSWESLLESIHNPIKTFSSELFFLSQRNLLILNGLFGGEARKPIIIADGTYVYISTKKSSNYLYQKITYSLHKYRNLVKPLLLVCSDGYIIDIFGPYPARTTNAEIIKQEFSNENSSCRRCFQPGDVFILDRGFRDSLPSLRRL